MNKGKVGVGGLQTLQKSVIPNCEVYLQVGYKQTWKGGGGERIRERLRGIRHTLDRRLVCQQESVLECQSVEGKPLTKI